MEQPAVFSLLAAACATVSHVQSAPLAPDMARLALSVVLVLCFALPQLSAARPTRTRKAVSPRQPGGTVLFFVLRRSIFLHLTRLTHLFYLCAAVEDDDVTSQLERLWQEVNSLKEMQALQTGTNWKKPETVFMREASGVLSVDSLLRRTQGHWGLLEPGG